jgi:O-antigen ligase
MNSPVQKTFDLNTVILCILITLSPLIFKFAPIPMLGKYFGAKVQLIEVAFCILFPIWFFLTVKKGDFKPRLPRGTLFFLGFVVIAFVSSLLSIDPKRSLLDSTSFLYLFLLLLFFYNLLSRKNLILSLKFFLIVSTVIIGIGFLGLLLYYFFGIMTFSMEVLQDNLGIHLVRVCSTFPTCNYMITYMGFAVAVAMFFLQFKEKGWVKILSLLVIGMSCVIILTQPYRGEFVIWGIIFFGLGHFEKERVVRFIRPIVLFLTIVFIFLFVVQGIINVTPVKTNEDTQTHRFDVSISTQPSIYYNIHKTATKIFRDYPIIGVGPGFYNEFMKQEKYGFDFLTYPKYKGIDPHSTYLGYLSETGILGVTFLLIFFVSVIRKLYMVSRGRDLFSRLFAQNVLSYFVLLLIYAFFIDIVTLRFLYFVYALVFFVADVYKPGDNSIST